MRVCSVCFPPQPHPPEIPTHNPQPPSTRDPHPQPLSTRDSHPQPHPRILFTDFSSAYNAIQPHILANKLVSYFSLDNHLVLWIIDFLTNRLQRVFVNGCFSKLSLTCTGSRGVSCLTSLHSIYRRQQKQPLKQVSGKICRRQCSTVTTSGI